MYENQSDTMDDPTQEFPVEPCDALPRQSVDDDPIQDFPVEHSDTRSFHLDGTSTQEHEGG